MYLGPAVTFRGAFSKRNHKQSNPSICLIDTLTFEDHFSPRSLLEDYCPLRVFSYGPTPPHLKNMFFRGVQIPVDTLLFLLVEVQ